MTLSYITNPTEFKAKVDELLEKINKAYELYWARCGFKHMKCPQIRVESIGRKFLKLSQFEERNGVWGCHCVHSFIDLTNGNLHKAATYKAPETTGKTKGVRTNIFNADVLDHITVHGTVYLNSGGGCFPPISKELAGI